MRYREHLEILKQGVVTWNRWRTDHPETTPYLIGVDLRGLGLRGVNLSRGGLLGANLSGSDLVGADLTFAQLSTANLAGADLSQANLIGATITQGQLTEARMSLTNLARADLSRADLSRAALRGAQLLGTKLVGASLRETNFSSVLFGGTIFGDNDLSEIEGLNLAYHYGPSTIGIDTIYRSKGRIPEGFLRGAGVPEDFITYMRSLAASSIEFYYCFIAYSATDQEFADTLYADLRDQSVRCWLATEDLKIGDEFRQRIDETIRLCDKVLLVLSEHSIGSAWVEAEVEAAMEKERRSKSTVLFPIRLDDAVQETNQAWAAHIRRTRHIGDFSRWQDSVCYQSALARLLHSLKSV